MLIELLILYSLVYFTGFLKERLICYDFFCATKVVWTCIHAYGGEWVIVSLLKAWNVTLVWIVCDDAVFNDTSRRYTP